MDQCAAAAIVAFSERKPFAVVGGRREILES